MEWIVILRQKGQGCDYTINCGVDAKIINAGAYDEAVRKVRDMIQEEYTGDRQIEECILARSPAPQPVNDWYEELKERAFRREQEQEQEEELAELERLQRKYPNQATRKPVR